MKNDADQILRTVAQRVVELREARGMTQTALAARLGVAQPRVHLIEQGEQNLTIRMMARLANALDVDVVELFAAPRTKQR